MTGILSNQLPGRANPPDADNPLGSFKDRTAPGANDGSYLTQTWANDRNSLLQALFIASGLIPNGVEDTGTASQLFDALVNNRWSSIGNYSVGTIVTASDGNQYYCNQANGRDTSVVDPVTDVLDNWRQFPYKTSISGSTEYRTYYDGRVLIFGRVTPSSGLASVSFPVSLSQIKANSVKITDLVASAPGTFNGVPQNTVIDSTISNTGFQISCLFPDGSDSNNAVAWQVEGVL